MPNLEAWKNHYGKQPYDIETEPRQDTTKESFAATMLNVFESSGLLTKMKDKQLEILASSVGSGSKDRELLKQLDKRIKQKGGVTQNITLSDFARTQSWESAIEKPESELENIDVDTVVADSRDLPFPDDSLDAIYERLGALYHAADIDASPAANQQTSTAKILGQYLRALKQDGVLIFDWFNENTDISTADAIKEALHIEGLENFFKKYNCEVSLAGNEDTYLIVRRLSEQ